MCTMRTSVPRDKAKDALLIPVATFPTQQPKWIEKTLAEMRRVLEEAARIPAEADADRRRLTDLESQIETLVDNLSRIRE